MPNINREPLTGVTAVHDLIIKGATVIDGAGNAARTADVAVDGDRIVAIGRVDGAAHETVAADGLVLAPGIVDLHTHYDAQLTWDATASPSPSLGVTTVVMGNCGFGIAPCPPSMRDLLCTNLSEVEAMPIDDLRAGIDWSFETFPEYMDLLRRKGSYPNAAVFIGHSTVRSVVMGAAGSERAATDDEIAAMKAIVRGALDAGAVGFASSHSRNHFGHGGVPMPSRLAEQRELDALVGTLGEAGHGVFQITVGPDDTVEELEALAALSGRPVIFSALFHNDAFPERAPTMLDQCSAAQSRGNRVYAQVGCQPLSMDFTLANAYPMQSLEVWDELKGASAERIAAAIADRSFRDRFRAQLAEPKRGKIFYGDWQRVEIAQAAQPANRPLEGLAITAIASERSVDPLDCFFDLALEERLGTVFSAKLLNADEDAVEPLLRHPASLVSLSDAGAHLALMCDAGYGLTLLGHWVRDRGALDLVEAVRQVTSVPADLYGIADRGRIAVGAFADLLLFDPASVGCTRSRRVHDMPGGGSRLMRDPVGVNGVWVNGLQVFDGHDYTSPDRSPGRILDQFAA